MGKYIKRSFSAKRGRLVIRGLEYRPEGEKLPIAIVCHGFMANMLTVKHYARKLASLGYAAYCFDFCGGSALAGRSDGKTTDMTVLTEVEDLLAVIEYASSLGYTDSSSLLLMGLSQGGLVSAITAARLGERVSKLVLFYPALCIPFDARAGRMMLVRFDPKNIPATLRCGPMKISRRYVMDVINMDPYREIAGYSGDLLILHGTKDRVVDISYVERARDQYLAEPCERRVVFRTIDGAGHMFNRRDDKLALAFLEEFSARK